MNIEKDIKVLDMNSIIIEGDDEKSKKMRKKKAAKLRKAEYRKRSLTYLTTTVRKGEK